jgi:endonuclease/exonuclease/phosphatase (EEP) superfamily protein YafD
LPTWRRTLPWLLVAPWAAWAAVRVLGIERGFPLVAMMAFTPYVLPVALVAGVAAAALRRWIPAAVAALTVLALALALAPRVAGGAEHAPGPRLRVLTLNSHYGNVSPGVLSRLVRRERADVLSLQELTPELADALTTELRTVLPHRVLQPAPEGAGTGLFSRFPLRATQAPIAAKYYLSAADARVPGAPPVRLLSVHASAPDGRRSAGLARDDLGRLPSAPARGPVQILAGDFNATLDLHGLRQLLGRGYRDAAEVVGAGLEPTWQGYLAPPLTLDHVLAPRRVAVLGVSVFDVPGSDHHALLASLALPSS